MLFSLYSSYLESIGVLSQGTYNLNAWTDRLVNVVTRSFDAAKFFSLSHRNLSRRA